VYPLSHLQGEATLNNPGLGSFGDFWWGGGKETALKGEINL